MKKSNKKVKSDRINALRKQYDAFLEEDKKRKERNNFILEKLDKMRSCTATVPIHSMPAPQMSQNSDLYARYGKILEKSAMYERYLSPPSPRLSLQVSKTQLDDPSLLREISKKYILIPKVTPPILTDCTETIKSMTDPDSDWKSKYDILNQLKQNDKLEHEHENITLDQKIYYDKFNVEEEQLKYQSSNEKIINKDGSDVFAVNNNSLVQFIKDKPEKDVSDIKTVCEKKHIDDHNKQNNDRNIESVLAMKNNHLYENYELEKNSSGVINDHHFKEYTLKQLTFVESPTVPPVKNEEHNDIEKETHDIVINSQILSNNAPTNQIPPQQNVPLQIIEQDYTQESTVDTNNVLSSQNIDTNSMGHTDSQILVKENTIDNSVRATENVQQNENIEYPVEIINVSEFTPYDGVELQDGVNINPHTNHEDSVLQSEQQNESTEQQNPVDVSGIEEFDAEQRDMFYTEQTNENYIYEQTNNEATYPEYVQNENYEQNEEYAYYENVQPEQAYPSEVNEFEETSQPYDQTYQEQYAAYDQKDYVQQENYEEQIQENEEGQNIDPNMQPEIDNLHYEQVDFEPQVIEQQLDNEQDYLGNEHVESSNEDIVLKNKSDQDLNNITNSEIQNSEIQGSLIQEDTLNN